MATAKKTTSTDIAVKKNTGIVSVAEQMAAMLAANAAKTAPSGGSTAIRITQDKHFVLPDGSKTADPIQVVIVDFNSRNEYYVGNFDPKNIQPPACFAIGDIPKDMAPSENSPDRQSDACTGCPMNEFGSKGAGKACKNQRMLALLPTDADESTPIWTIKVSPTAISKFDGYVKNVQRMFGVPPVGVVTTLSFDETADYAQLKFSDPVPNENVGVHLARLEEAREILNSEPDVSSFQAQPVRMPVRRTPAVARR